MYLLREPAVQVPDSDLECMLGPREPREETGGRKCWQCAAAAFVLGLLMMTAFALKPDTGLTSSAVSDTVQMESMEDPVWKQVLGRKAFKQFEHDQDHQEVSTTGTTSSGHLTASTTLATEVTTAKSSVSIETTTVTLPVSEAVTAAPLVAPAAPSPIVQDSPGKVDKIVISSQGSGNPLDQIAREFMDEAGKLNPESEEHKSLKNIGKMLSGFAASVTHVPMESLTTTGAAQPPPAPVRSATVESPLAPHEALKDGNKCPSDEEESEGTCFKKCADLTAGYYPIRTSAFSCCKAEPCTFFNSKIHVGFCSGFDIAGDAEGDGCPSFEGACLLDEEMFGGFCYKKCSLFSEGQIYSHRVAPNVCCSKNSFMCLLPKYSKFSMDFAVGGGKGDGNAQTPAQPHLPMKQLTEMDA